MVMSCYAKYWIYVCGGMFIMVSFAGKLVGYKIIYMLLFLLCLCVYQVGTGLQTPDSGLQSSFLKKVQGSFRYLIRYFLNIILTSEQCLLESQYFAFF